MLGWHVSVYRQPDGASSPATFESREGARLAVWQTDVGGLDWLIELAKQGKAIDLGGNGYPSRFTARAEILVPHLLGGTFSANETWLIGEGSYIADAKAWVGKTEIDQEGAQQCRPDEWLLVEVWDES
jgi:hypothetical protein